MSQFNATTFSIDRPTGQCAFTGRVFEPGEDYIAALIESDSPDAESPDSESNEASESASASASKATKKKTDDESAPDIGFRRIDVSLEAWDEGHRPDGVFAHWKAEVAEPNAKKKVFVDNDVLLNLLRRLADADAPDRIAFRFVLALILMRKKMVRYDRTENRKAMVTTTVPPSDEEAPGNPGKFENTETAETITEEVEQEWWLLTPKLDPAKGPMGKWNDEESIEVMNPRLDDERITQVTEQLGEILNGEL